MQTQQHHTRTASLAHPVVWSPLSHFFSLSFLLSPPFPSSLPDFPLIIFFCRQHLSIHRGGLWRGNLAILLFPPISPPLIHCLPDWREIQRHPLLPEMRYPAAITGERESPNLVAPSTSRNRLDLFLQVYCLFCLSGCLGLSNGRCSFMNGKQYPFRHKAKALSIV